MEQEKAQAKKQKHISNLEDQLKKYSLKNIRKQPEEVTIQAGDDSLLESVLRLE